MNARHRIPGGQASLIAAGLCSVLLLLASGCRQTGPAVQFVEGRITLDGQPLEEAIVSLVPSTGSTGLPAYGMTNSDGMFVVTSVRGGRVGAGAVAGDYIVTVQKKRTANEADIGINITRQEYEKQKLDHKKYEYFQPVIQVVPTAYNAADSSGMRVIVKKGRNTGPGFHFDLSPGFKGK